MPTNTSWLMRFGFRRSPNQRRYCWLASRWQDSVFGAGGRELAISVSSSQLAGSAGKESAEAGDDRNTRLSTVGVMETQTRSARTVTTPRVALLACLTALFIGCSGCGGGDRPKTVHIEGRVTLDGGDWPQAGELYFLPIAPEEGYPRRAATAKFGTDGVLSPPTSWEEGDGVVPGKYRLFVECWKVPPTRTGPPSVSFVADKYMAGATSDIEVTITAESANEELLWDFPSKGG